MTSEAALRKEAEVYDLQQRKERQAAEEGIREEGQTEGRMTKNKKESEGFETALKTGSPRRCAGHRDTEDHP